MTKPSIPPDSLQATYLFCSGCKRKIPYADQRIEVMVMRGGMQLWRDVLCLNCHFGAARVVRNRSQGVAAARCLQMREMRQQGELLKNIGRTFGLDHSTVIHHLQGRCKCQA